LGYQGGICFLRRRDIHRATRGFSLPDLPTATQLPNSHDGDIKPN
jgi:hypothetical protein